MKIHPILLTVACLFSLNSIAGTISLEKAGTFKGGLTLEAEWDPQNQKSNTDVGYMLVPIDYKVVGTLAQWEVNNTADSSTPGFICKAYINNPKQLHVSVKLKGSKDQYNNKAKATCSFNTPEVPVATNNYAILDLSSSAGSGRALVNGKQILKGTNTRTLYTLPSTGGGTWTGTYPDKISLDVSDGATKSATLLSVNSSSTISANVKAQVVSSTSNALKNAITFSSNCNSSMGRNSVCTITTNNKNISPGVTSGNIRLDVSLP